MGKKAQDVLSSSAPVLLIFLPMSYFQGTANQRRGEKWKILPARVWIESI
jgi:hypothetical protein